MSINPMLQTQIVTLNREDVMGNIHYAKLLRFIIFLGTSAAIILPAIIPYFRTIYATR